MERNLDELERVPGSNQGRFYYKMAKKICIVSNTSWSIYNFRLGLMKVLKERGYEVVAIAPYDRYGKIIEKDFKFVRLNSLDRKAASPVKDVVLFIELLRIYKREKPSIVLHFTIKPNIYSSLACRVAGIKSISSVTGLGYSFITRSYLTLLVKFLYKISFLFTNKIIFQNEEDRSYFVDKKIIKTDKSLRTPGSGVNTRSYSPDFCKDKKKDGLINFLLIARLLWDKGIGEFIEAVKIVRKKCSNIGFQILGKIDTGNPAAIDYDIVREWENEGLIEYLGSKQDVRPYICRSDVVVLPSYREGMPRSLLEALAMGKPIITANTVGCREVINNDLNGFLVPVKDGKALAGAMIRMIDIGYQKRKEMGAEGRRMVLNSFDERIVIDRYLQAISDVLKG